VGGGAGFQSCTLGGDGNRGGNGGGLTGENGYSWNSYNSSNDGAGGTQIGGGVGAGSGLSGVTGSLGSGGAGYTYFYAGGGGGGYYGGGGGDAGGGGGGSSYTDASVTSSITHTQGYNTTNADTVFITVNCSGGVINGNTALCAGFTTVLTDTVGGSSGTWSSGNTSIATVGSSSGTVTGVSTGTANITYSVIAYCGFAFSFVTVTVNPMPTAILGTQAVCAGSTTGLSDALTGGTWTSSNTVVATVGSSTGVVTGASAGTATITYTTGVGVSCVAITTVTVNPMPSSILGAATVCVGLTAPLSDAAGGGVWSSSSTTIATIGPTGIVSGLITGTTTITYGYPATGCNVFKTVTVTPLPSVITGVTSICTGTTTSLFDAGGGTWSSNNTAIAIIGSGSGLVNGLATGTSVVTYTLPSGCITTTTITVNPLPAAITGVMEMCQGLTATLSDATPGGNWSSSNTTIATIGSVTGIVTGITGGSTAIITYTSSFGCTAIATVTVDPLPALISGSTHICTGSTASLSDATAGGTWTSSATSIATIGNTTGIATGIAAGTTIISYVFPITGCLVTTTLTVDPLPSAITGTFGICTGSTTPLTDAGGGTWTSSNTTVATIGAGTGVASGIASGTATITYKLSTGCMATVIVTVNLSSPITGISSVCTGTSITLSDAAVGGTWSSSNTMVSVGTTSGIVTGLIPGTTTITYSLGTSCIVTKTITVSVSPLAITGTPTICAGATTTLSDPTIGGTWSSSNTTIATVISGIITGVSAGTATISYMTGTCPALKTVTVNPAPFPISGSGGVCAGLTIALSDAVGGGAWSSSNTVIATAGTSTGIVTGVTAGTATITYSLGAGCIAIKNLTVNALSAITGGSSVCSSATIPLSDAITGGTWSSTVTSVATVSGTGVVTGIALGTTTISYVLPTGCTASKTITVSPIPTPITGPSTVCVASTISLSDAVAGGTWTSSNTSIVTVTSISGTVSGIAPGTSTISYSLGSGCTISKTLTVYPAPAIITGISAVCVGGTASLSDAVTGGVWSSDNTSIATINTAGTVTGILYGTATISYTLSAGGCAATKIITVNPTPTAILGIPSVCLGNTTTLSDGVGGGLWSTSYPAAGVGSTTGIVTGISAGTAIITYSLGAGCSTTKTVTVNPLSPVTGITIVCVGQTTVLSDLTIGGTWSSASTGIATITSTGIVTGVSAGTTTISYVLPTGCIATALITVNSAPLAIYGSTHVCSGGTITLSDPSAGGIWSSSNTAIANIGSGSGIVTGISTGTAKITYSLGSGCVVNTTITVTPGIPAITGSGNICAGSAIVLSDGTTGGTWSSFDPTVGVGISTGTVTGILGGTATITYSMGAGCDATKMITINPTPSPITGTANLCVGSTTALSDPDFGGTWSSTNTTVATVGASTGIVAGIVPGTAIISYSFGTGCGAAFILGVNSMPATITGATSVCVGASTTLSDPSVGGTWSCGDPTAGVAIGTGVVTGIATGSATITYTNGKGCIATKVMTVISLPPAISVSSNVCIGSTATLTDPAIGGTWSSSSIAIVIIGSGTGIVTGILTGSATITYSLGTSCIATIPVTVYPVPSAISGPNNLCPGSSVTLSDGTGGGSWNSPYLTVSVGAGTGIVTGITAGTAIISYTVPTGCAATETVTINPLPKPITGVINMCAGGTTMYVHDSDAPAGIWTSSWVTITPAGLVSAYNPGPATITYTLPTGCMTISALTVNPVPKRITGANSVCTGLIIALTDTTTGYVWSSLDPTVVVGAGTGIVTGISAGTAVISYSMPTGCMVTDTINIYQTPSIITGSAIICAGATITLFDSLAGGKWTSSTGGVATIGLSTGVVTGISVGVATITYSATDGCMASKSVTIAPLPAVYAVIGGGSICAGGTGIHVQLSGSAMGINYKLYNSGVLIDSLRGTGGFLDYGLETAAGTYMATATDTSTMCNSSMADSAVIIVNPVLTPMISVSVVPGTTVCEGTPVSYTAVPVNGGIAPKYEWRVNGIYTGNSTASYNYIPVYADVVDLIMTSNATCVAPATIYTIVPMSVVTPIAPDVTITAYPATGIAKGQIVTFIAAVANGMVASSYQWLLNNIPVAGETNATYTTSSLINNDVVGCEVSSNGICTTNATTSIRMNISDEGVIAPGSSPEQILSVLPNPAHGELIITGAEGCDLKIYNLVGQQVYTTANISDKEVLNINNLIPGVYILQGMQKNGVVQNIRFVKE